MLHFKLKIHQKPFVCRDLESLQRSANSPSWIKGEEEGKLATGLVTDGDLH